MRRQFTQYESVPLSRSVQTNMQLIPEGALVEVEGYVDEVFGGSWKDHAGNWAIRVYEDRLARDGLPFDDEVVYAKFGGLGSLIHVSELS